MDICGFMMYFQPHGAQIKFIQCSSSSVHVQETTSERLSELHKFWC
jgi:hypothetical protein